MNRDRLCAISSVETSKRNAIGGQFAALLGELRRNSKLAGNTRVSLLSGTPQSRLRAKHSFSSIPATLATSWRQQCCRGNEYRGERIGKRRNGAMVFASSIASAICGRCRLWEWSLYQGAGRRPGGKADNAGKGTISVNMLDPNLFEREKKRIGEKQIITTTKPNTASDSPNGVRR